jgi:Heavy metal associated domain 2
MSALAEAQLPQARVCHYASGRLRIKIPEKRRDEGFFEAVRQRLSGWDSVKRVEVNPLTASVLVEFTSVFELFAENAVKNDLFEVDFDALQAMGEPPPALTEQAAEVFGRVDAAFRRWTADGADLRSAIFLVLLAGGVYQLLRGNIAAPAATLLWYAGATLRLWDVAPASSNGTAAVQATAGE